MARYERGGSDPNSRCIPGPPPVDDDEYIEFVHVLLSIVDHDPARPYVMLELGAGYGVWTVRSIAALRQLRGADVAYVAVPVERLREQCAANDVNCTIVNAFVPRDLSHGQVNAMSRKFELSQVLRAGRMRWRSASCSREWSLT